MGASYVALGMQERATFSLFLRRLPEKRSFIVVAGIEEAIRRLEHLRFDPHALDPLSSAGRIRQADADALVRTRFTGDVWAVPEGRVLFADEPILEVEAPIVEAQLVETLLLNAVHFATLVATKAARCVAAAPGKSLVDFGLRRAPGIEGGLVVARAAFLSGFDATSNVLAGSELGIPVSGTVAHSFIEAFPDERSAYRALVATASGPLTLLVDTYDTTAGVAHAIQIAKETGARITAVRLDSGDLDTLSRQARRMLDEAGLQGVRIVASGGLDEYALRKLARASAPIDAYGVGTRLGMSADAPVLDMAYKIVDYGGRPCLKLSEGKTTLVGAKQVWRRRADDGYFAGDIIAARDESAPGEAWEPLLEQMVFGGRPIALPTLAELRTRHRKEIEAMPAALLDIEQHAPYPVACSATLMDRQRAAILRAREREGLACPKEVER